MGRLEEDPAKSLREILPKPDKKLTKQIWDSFGGVKGLRSKLNILSGGKYLKGGAFLREEATLEQEKNVLTLLNDILIRSLLLVILKKTKSIVTSGIDANFPIFPIQKSDNNKIIANYNYNRPKFVEIFSEGLLTKDWRDQNIIPGGGGENRSPVDDSGNIVWGNIYGVFESFSIEPPLKLEERKRIARILFLNVERLVLYYQLVAGSHSIDGDDDSSDINKKYLLQALEFIVDTTKQTYKTCDTRGFSTTGFFQGGDGKQGETKASRARVLKDNEDNSSRPESNGKFGTIAEMKTKCIKERQKYFGWLFGDDLKKLSFLEQKRDKAGEKSKKKKYSKKINALIGEPPDWFRASTPDDQIQLAYNEIVRKLLPEYILTAGSHRNELYKHLASDVDFPRPVEMSKFRLFK